MDWIDDTVAVGNRFDAVRTRTLRREGIDLVMDARLLFTKHYFSSRRSPILDRALHARDLLVGISPQKPRVLIFCNRGRDRSPFIAMLYISNRYGMNSRDAYELVRSKRTRTVVHGDWAEMIEDTYHGKIE
jgi:hypothetical protein